MMWPFGPLRPLAGYEVIVANPPLAWELYSEKGEGKSYQRTHGAMPLADIKALPVGHLARDPCVVLLCSPKTRLDLGLEIMAAWGIIYKSEVVVRKITRRGKPWMGTGLRVRDMHLPFLLGTIGSPKHKPFRSLIDGVARKNGDIPHALFEECERCCPKRWMVELFAPGPRPGWDTWGFEPGKFDAVVHVGGAPLQKTERLLQGKAVAA